MVIEPDLKLLPPKHRLFVREYVSNGMNATQAALAVGYSDKSAPQRGPALLRKPNIAAAVATLVECRNQRLKISADWVLQEAVTVYERCMSVEKILDRDGNPTGEFRFDASNAIKALALIGKHVDVQAFDAAPGDTRENEILQRLLRGRQRAVLPAPEELDDEDEFDDLDDDTPPVSFMEPQEPSQWEPEPSRYAEQDAVLERLQRGRQRQTAEHFGYPGSIVVDGEWSEGGRD